MQARLGIVAGGVMALVVAGCSSAFRVHTMVSPDARFTSLVNFRVLQVPRPRDSRPEAGAYDPMVNNSIANRALREAIVGVLVSHGYVQTEREPDFAVAVYASAREKLDVQQWDYGYPFGVRRRWPGYPQQTVTEYTEGTVIVDVIQPVSRDLLWRGSGSTRLSKDPSEDVKELQKLAEAIMKKFPRAARPSVVIAQ